jgi:hypothetical protein
MGTITRYKVTLAVLAGARLPAFASEGPQTQANPSAYAVVARINDPKPSSPVLIKSSSRAAAGPFVFGRKSEP